jgi:cytochrome c553
MHPGQACIACHERDDEGPRFLLAGTAYPSAHEPDECYGANGDATVVIKGADGRTVSLRLQSSGNFFLEAEDDVTLALPYTAVLRYDGRERAMATPQTIGDCNSCHSQEGANGAPGRVTLP